LLSESFLNAAAVSCSQGPIDCWVRRSTLPAAATFSSRSCRSNCSRLRKEIHTSGCSKTAMGPVYASANASDKIERIRSILRENHGAASSDGIQVIMDFDLTMTAPGSQQCHHMFETSPTLPEELRGRLAPYLNGQIKVSSPEEWWEAFHGLLVDGRLTREQVVLVARGASVTLREGTAELMLLLRDLGVPLLIASAGISNIIEETLRRHGLLLENVTIRANTMVFGEDGTLKSFRESPPIHSRNKKQMAEREREYFESHAARRCVLVVGDKPGDADMSHGVAPEERCLKIGFFDHSREHPHPDLPPLPPPLSLPAVSAGSDGSHPDGAGHSYAWGGGFELGAQTRDYSPWSPADEEEGHDEPSRSCVHASATDLADLGGHGASSGPPDLTMAPEGRRAHGEEPSRQDSGFFLAADQMLIVYGDSFDVVARDGHSMGLVTDVLRHVIGDSGDRAGSPLKLRD
ncbi:unnamed protein product, partial [Ascophyllum nodosum]